MSQENVETVRAVIEAFGRRDVETILAHSHPEIEMTTLRSAIQGPYRGHDGVRRWAAELLDMASDYWVHMDELRAIDDRVLVLGSQGGRADGSGAPFEAPLAILATVAAGQVTHVQAYPTHVEALEAAGLQE